MPWMAALGLVGGAGADIFGSLTGANAAQQASRQQTNAQMAALRQQQQQFQQTQNNFAPFLQGGTGAFQQLLSQLGPGGQLGSSAFQQAQDQFGQAPTYNLPQFGVPQYQQSPGYQFQLNQGMDAIQNSAAGRTGALSGNTLKALGNYGTGLANQDWYTAQNVFDTNYNNTYNAQNNQWWQKEGAINQGQNNLFTWLQNIGAMGQNAAGGLGTLGQANANAQTGILGNIGNAQAAGTIGSANNMIGGVNSLSQLLLSPQNAFQNSFIGSLFGQQPGSGAGSNYSAGLPGASPA